MKKIVLLALTLFVAGTMYADKKCCKDKAACTHKTEAKSCNKDAAKGKSCCKKGSEGQAAVNNDGTIVATPAGNCAKGTTGKSCCKDKHAASTTTPAGETKPAGSK